jgi:transposase InsO family protein
VLTVVETLEGVCRRVGYPKAIRVDQGSEFISRDLDIWAYHKGVILDFSRPGKPTDNAFIESFNGKFRTECLNVRWFMSLDDTARNWRLGVETITSFVRTAHSAKRRRSHSRFAQVHPTRPEPMPPEIRQQARGRGGAGASSSDECCATPFFIGVVPWA